MCKNDTSDFGDFGDFDGAFRSILVDLTDPLKESEWSTLKPITQKGISRARRDHPLKCHRLLRQSGFTAGICDPTLATLRGQREVSQFHLRACRYLYIMTGADWEFVLQ